jgi:dolichol kinase
MPVDLEDAVERTSGPQLLRRVFHAATGLLIVLALAVGGLQKREAIWVLAGALVVLGAADVLRARSDVANTLFFKLFRHLASPRDATGLASSTWYALGVLVVLSLFPYPAAISAILVLALADPVASYAGRRWGRIAFLGGSLEGTLIFTLVALALLLPRHPPLIAVVTALCSAVVERVSWPFDDNFTVPVATAAMLTVLGAVF